ncbi:uncharacterized protein C4B3.18-like isoform X2 [Stegodyphus dumicola]|uniref:uncharacterized protein C4B3.18-like isoform X1 n=2 Tax=Stegodyphus dumicola TaxID=202533 RepID=UPI0015A8DAF5|nr:uncharacterized protein C4B3.18-like isoform X1 [Stegodyphus dumicola]XP_035222991.1 uncharacterized protein C4B3.18-like isoform X2 [Stegodyphus dumicola]
MHVKKSCNLSHFTLKITEMSKEAWEKFYNENPPPSELHNIQEQMKNFCNYHASKGNYVVLVTSGGTIVPLEHNTVRFVDNFSAGTRGAASAEYFLKSGCAVIFMHRTKSLEPFVRHVSVSDLLDSLRPNESSDNSWKLEVQGSICNKLIQLTKAYKGTLAKNMLLKIQFTTLSSYLHLLFVAAHAMKNLGNDAIFYLAAAVSDFYIPEQEMVYILLFYFAILH